MRDAGGDAVEDGVEADAERTHGDHDEEGDQARHQAVLDGGGAVLVLEGGEAGLHEGEELEHGGGSFLVWCVVWVSRTVRL